MTEPNNVRLTSECGHHCVLFTVRPESPPVAAHCACPECHDGRTRAVYLVLAEAERVAGAM